MLDGGGVSEGGRSNAHQSLSRSGASFLLETQEEDDDDEEKEERSSVCPTAAADVLSDFWPPGVEKAEGGRLFLMLISFSCNYIKDQRLPLRSS